MWNLTDYTNNIPQNVALSYSHKQLYKVLSIQFLSIYKYIMEIVLLIFQIFFLKFI